LNRAAPSAGNRVGREPVGCGSARLAPTGFGSTRVEPLGPGDRPGGVDQADVISKIESTTSRSSTVSLRVPGSSTARRRRSHLSVPMDPNPVAIFGSTIQWRRSGQRLRSRSCWTSRTAKGGTDACSHDGFGDRRGAHRGAAGDGRSVRVRQHPPHAGPCPGNRPVGRQYRRRTQVRVGPRLFSSAQEEDCLPFGRVLNRCGYGCTE